MLDRVIVLLHIADMVWISVLHLVMYYILSIAPVGVMVGDDTAPNGPTVAACVSFGVFTLLYVLGQCMSQVILIGLMCVSVDHGVTLLYLRVVAVMQLIFTVCNPVVVVVTDVFVHVYYGRDYMNITNMVLLSILVLQGVKLALGGVLIYTSRPIPVTHSMPIPMHTHNSTIGHGLRM
jgi:hypothetical protein